MKMPLTEIIKTLYSSLMVCRYCYRMSFALMYNDVKSEVQLTTCLPMWLAAKPCHYGDCLCFYPYLPCSQREVAERAQQVVRPRGTGKVQMPGHIMCTQSLRRASQHFVWPSMFVYSHRSSYQFLACTEPCTVRKTCDTLS